MTQAERIRESADRLSYWTATDTVQRELRRGIATGLGVSLQAVVSALRSGARPGPRKRRCSQCTCALCGGTWTATRPRKAS